MTALRTALLTVVIGTAAVSCGRPSSPAPKPAASTPKIVGYLASWGVRSKGTRIADLPGDQLTHIIYAFARIGEDGRLALGDPCLDIGQCGPAGSAPPTTDGG